MAIPEDAKPIIKEIIAKFIDQPEHFKQELKKYFDESDTDGNGTLDRKEIRGFLKNFFENFQINLPLTDEYCDAIFRKLDADRSNSIEVEELVVYATEFMTQLNAGL